MFQNNFRKSFGAYERINSSRCIYVYESLCVISSSAFRDSVNRSAQSYIELTYSFK